MPVDEIYDRLALAVSAADWQSIDGTARFPRSVFYNENVPEVTLVIDVEKHPDGFLTVHDDRVEVLVSRFDRVPTPKHARAMLRYFWR